MTLNKCPVLRIGTLTGGPLCRESHPLCRLKNPTVVYMTTCRLSSCKTGVYNVHLLTILERGCSSMYRKKDDIWRQKLFSLIRPEKITCIYEPWQDKTNKMMCAQRSPRSTCTSAQSDQSLCCELSGKPRTQGFFMRTAKTLIRLDGCPGWPESSLGAHIILLVLSCCGSCLVSIFYMLNIKLCLVGKHNIFLDL